MKSVIVLCLYLASAWAVPLIDIEPSRLQVVQSHRGRIVGGEVAKEGQFKHQVAVYYDNDQGSFFCGGALISSKWVLTAGHCVYHAREFTLHLGSNNLVTNDTNRVVLGAAHSVIHPDFDLETLQNDIGLVRIDTPYDMNDHIAVIPLASSELSDSVEVTVSGWGASGDWDGVEPALHYVQLKTITNDACNEVYGGAIHDGMVCASGTWNEGVCNGDSGSPLIVSDENGNAIHVGLASFASATGCTTDHPSGFTRTAYYADWIKEHISE